MLTRFSNFAIYRNICMLNEWMAHSLLRSLTTFLLASVATNAHCYTKLIKIRENATEFVDASNTMTSTSTSSRTRTSVDTSTKHQFCCSSAYNYARVFGAGKFVLKCKQFLLFSFKIWNAMCECCLMRLILNFNQILYVYEYMNEHYPKMLCTSMEIGKQICCCLRSEKLLLFKFQQNQTKTSTNQTPFSRIAWNNWNEISMTFFLFTTKNNFLFKYLSFSICTIKYTQSSARLRLLSCVVSFSIYCCWCFRFFLRSHILVHW